jgi:hypothetical protein
MAFDRPTAADVELLWLAALRNGSSYRRPAFYSIGRMAEASTDLREATIGRLVDIDVADSKIADDVCAARRTCAAVANEAACGAANGTTSCSVRVG